MTKKKGDITTWLEKFKGHWLKKDVSAAVELFRFCKSYKETPFSNEINDIKAIEELWKEILNQSEIELEFKVLTKCYNSVTVNYKFSCKINRTIHKSDGIYFISFNKNGDCVKFWQWFMTEKNDN